MGASVKELGLVPAGRSSRLTWSPYYNMNKIIFDIILEDRDQFLVRQPQFSIVSEKGTDIFDLRIQPLHRKGNPPQSKI